MAVRTFATCICGHVGGIPPNSVWKEERKESCDDPECGFLDKCRSCEYRNFLTRYCSCDCDRCTIISFTEAEIQEKNKASFGLTGVSRLPKGERWNYALGEYCLTTGDVEKYRKQQGKHYVPDDEPPRPYQPSDSEESKKKRRQFAKNAFNVEIRGNGDRAE